MELYRRYIAFHDQRKLTIFFRPNQSNIKLYKKIHFCVAVTKLLEYEIIIQLFSMHYISKF